MFILLWVQVGSCSTQAQYGGKIDIIKPVYIVNASLNTMRIHEGTSCWDEEFRGLQRGDEDYCVFDDGGENPCTRWLLISDDETVTIIRTITTKTITGVKMMRMKIFLWLCRIFFCAQILKANMVVGAIWCLMVCYQISHAEHKRLTEFTLSFHQKCGLPTISPTQFSICMHFLFRSMFPISLHALSDNLVCQHF